MALRRLVIGPVWQDEEPDSAQHVKQLVSPQLDAALDRCRSVQMMQFSGSEPRLAPAPSRFRLRAATSFALTSLATGLMVDAHVAAGTPDTQLFDPVLRDDLPEGFFTVIP